jgi:hypothetical protein
VLDRENARTARSTSSAPLSPPAAAPPAAEPLVARLATALGALRPWQRITDPERARGYFEARARHMLATASDPLALVEREERETARWATPTSTSSLKEILAMQQTLLGSNMRNLSATTCMAARGTLNRKEANR